MNYRIFSNFAVSKTKTTFMILEEMKTQVVGVDIKLSRTTCAIVDIRGNILASDEFPTEAHPVIGDYVAVLSDHIMQLIEQHSSLEKVRSVGISAPSGNYQTGSIVNSPNMPWKGIIPLAALLRDRLGLSVALGNNAYAMALGEYAFGAAHGMQNFAVVSLGSGIGSCFFSGGHVHLGADGFAGELGHTCIVNGGRECGCGNKGCLEAYCAEKGLIRTARELMEESDKPSLMRNLEQLSYDSLILCCEQGDELAIETYRRTGELLGIGLANFASVLDPEAIIFTGNGANAGHWLLEPANEAFESHIFLNTQNKIKFIVSSMESNVRNLLGASVLAWEVEEYSLFK